MKAESKHNAWEDGKKSLATSWEKMSFSVEVACQIPNATTEMGMSSTSGRPSGLTPCLRCYHGMKQLLEAVMTSKPRWIWVGSPLIITQLPILEHGHWKNLETL